MLIKKKTTEKPAHKLTDSKRRNYGVLKYKHHNHLWCWSNYILFAINCQ